jgi:PAS domain S-box-containing protein
MFDLVNGFLKEGWFFEYVLQNMRDSIIVTDIDSKIVYVNTATEELFGYSREEMLGQNPGIVNAEPNAEEIQELILKTMLDVGKWEGQLLNRKKNGDLFTVEIRICSLKDPEDNSIGFIGYQKDVTDICVATKRVEESEEQFKRIFQATSVGIHLWELNENDDLILINSNPAADHFTGIKNAELYGKTIEEAFPSMVGTESVERYKIAASQGVPWHTSSYIYKDTNIDGVYDIWVFKISRNRIVAQFMEVSGRMAKEIELRKSNEDLEEFAYVASHDLQEPLRVVSSYCQLLKEKHYSCMDEESKKYLDYSISSAMRMKTLIKELLDFSRVGRKDKPFEKINLQELLEEVLCDFEVTLKETKAEIIMESNMPNVMGISFRMKQLLHNIISNSLKFRSDKKPIIRIGCCEDSKRMNYWLFYIKDNGIGIDPKYYDRVFGIFKRLYSREEYPGTGIGLALCKKIVEAHGGEIWVESENREGTYVYFTISKSWDIF